VETKYRLLRGQGVDMKNARLTDATVKRLPAPATGNKVHYDAVVTGLGCRVTEAGHKAFVLTYRTKLGRQRRITIGSFPDWSVVGAREEAKRLKREIDSGADPLAAIETAKAEPTFAELAGRVVETHFARKRRRTGEEYERLLRLHLLPTLGKLRVSEIRFADCDALHRRISKGGSPIAANRAHSLLRVIFSFAVKWGMRADNPCVGVERNSEHPVERYLSRAELERLTAALDQEADQQAADIFRLLLLTGCRIGEALSARWEHIDLTAGIWNKPHQLTKTAKKHVVPLSRAAIELLSALRRKTNSEFVFPGNGSTGHRHATFKAWARVRKAAGLGGFRIHDLRHSFASELVSSGASLPLIGRLLGHTDPATTARYSHLYDDPLRAAVERVGKVVSNGGRR
jgi:integrase